MSKPKTIKNRIHKRSFFVVFCSLYIKIYFGSFGTQSKSYPSRITTFFTITSVASNYSQFYLLWINNRLLARSRRFMSQAVIKNKNLKIIFTISKTHSVIGGAVILKPNILIVQILSRFNGAVWWILKFKSVFIIPISFPTYGFIGGRWCRSWRYRSFGLSGSRIWRWLPGNWSRPFNKYKISTNSNNGDNYYNQSDVCNPFLIHIFDYEMIKNFSSPKIKIWFEPMFFSGFFCGFQRSRTADNFKFFFGGIQFRISETNKIVL